MLTNFDTRELYLDLMIRCLTNMIYEDPAIDPWANGRFIIKNRLDGTDWPSVAHTMIGVHRLITLKELCETVIKENVPGDFIETGVWRGGATIFMRAILKAHNVIDRTVWVADSFEGLPKPNSTLYPNDINDQHHTFEQLKVSLDQVKENFHKYNLLDNQVRFLKGWFKDTLPGAPIEKLSILRLDGDMYESTTDTLNALYAKLSPGGFVIFDDANSIEACANAILDFRKQHNITAKVYRGQDNQAVWWRKE